jgi:hypothetical protein
MIGSRMLEMVRDSFPRWSGTLYKGALLSMVVLAFVIPLSLVALPFVEFFNGMAAQPKGKAQSTHGRIYGQEILVERKPVVGTVHRAWARYEFEDRAATMEGAKEVGELLENPFPVTLEGLRRGRELYDIYCIACHGKEGAGDGPITGPERFPAPPSLHTEQARGYRDGTIYHIISKGTEKMPQYADKIDLEERWDVVNYVRALQRAMNPRPEDMP